MKQIIDTFQIGDIQDTFYKKINPTAYFNYLKKKKIIPSAFAVVMGSLISGIVKILTKDLIIPLSKGKVKKLYKNLRNAPKLYGALVINFFVTTYILFVVGSFFE